MPTIMDIYEVHCHKFEYAKHALEVACTVFAIFLIESEYKGEMTFDAFMLMPQFREVFLARTIYRKKQLALFNYIGEHFHYFAEKDIFFKYSNPNDIIWKVLNDLV